ncbi:MAG: hypothetical protein G01um101448_801 [Parcubacteria group bacterium Gr01-1014_48]|nr:MAG: hypothetical protein Greene041614_346 [Parcubacteria group bacterium Greene0416_14]TSC73349.1 MAG: hypothetical protein G01um101448_801 [Parcubacteria group bacterium Gr01-1014_48]TSD01314.1 MAG: hypothetical protein Greene101415_328 [Parcubacteria group bacterium Greene1014_15]TSD08001.1 MAG: hypothetical protein Greene07144_489 [Parcubacteria group bacterium Greene0714_4]
MQKNRYLYAAAMSMMVASFAVTLLINEAVDDQPTRTLRLKKLLALQHDFEYLILCLPLISLFFIFLGIRNKESKVILFIDLILVVIYYVTFFIV